MNFINSCFVLWHLAHPVSLHGMRNNVLEHIGLIVAKLFFFLMYTMYIFENMNFNVPYSQ